MSDRDRHPLTTVHAYDVERIDRELRELRHQRELDRAHSAESQVAIYDRIETSEARVIERIDAMDVRVNGRIRALENWRRNLTIINRALDRLARYPIAIAVGTSAAAAAVTYLLSH